MKMDVHILWLNKINISSNIRISLYQPQLLIFLNWFKNKINSNRFYHFVAHISSIFNIDFIGASALKILIDCIHFFRLSFFQTSTYYKMFNRFCRFNCRSIFHFNFTRLTKLSFWEILKYPVLIHFSCLRIMQTINFFKCFCSEFLDYLNWFVQR